jgi:hypothetical protein
LEHASPLRDKCHRPECGQNGRSRESHDDSPRAHSLHLLTFALAAIISVCRDADSGTAFPELRPPVGPSYGTDLGTVVLLDANARWRDAGWALTAGTSMERTGGGKASNGCSDRLPGESPIRYCVLG